jgi:hypothetical protein
VELFHANHTNKESNNGLSKESIATSDSGHVILSFGTSVLFVLFVPSVLLVLSGSNGGLRLAPPLPFGQ